MSMHIKAKKTGRGGHHFARYRQIAGVLMKYHLKEPIETLGMERYLPLRWMPPALPWRKQRYSKAERMSLALEEMGTTFIKLGQILSTRADLLPAEYVKELAKLQNCLKPLPAELLKEVVVAELGHPMEQLFTSFDENLI